MKWIGQHIWDFISRFRSDVYLEGVAPGEIASGGMLGLDSSDKVVKTNAADNVVVTDSNTNTAFPVVFHDESNSLLDDTGGFTYNSMVGLMGVENAILSNITVNNTADTATAGSLYLKNLKGGAEGDIGDLCGKLGYWGNNNDSTPEAIMFAQVYGEIVSNVNTDEAGKLVLQALSSDGNTASLKNALTLTGHATDSTVAATIGYGATSTTTIAGDLHVGGETITSDGYSGQSMSAGTLSWNGTSCKIFPNEFMVDDGGGTWRINETGGGVYSGRFSNTSTEAICYFRIPDGKKVTSVKFNTTTTVSNICSVRPMNYITGQAGTEDTFNSNALYTLSPAITGAVTNDLLLTFKPASITTGLFGVLITIADV